MMETKVFDNCDIFPGFSVAVDTWLYTEVIFVVIPNTPTMTPSYIIKVSHDGVDWIELMERNVTEKVHEGKVVTAYTTAPYRYVKLTGNTSTAKGLILGCGKPHVEG